MKNKRILSMLLAVLFVLSTFTFSTATVFAAGGEVYIDGVNGDDGNKGTLDSPFKTMSKALGTVGSTGGTVYIIGTYHDRAGAWASNAQPVTVRGYGDDAVLTCDASAGIIFSGDIILENLTLNLGLYAHINTYGHTLTFGEGFVPGANCMTHIGNQGGTTASEHVIVTGGATLPPNNSFGGAYSSNSSAGVSGDITIEILDGTATKINLNQDGYQDSHQKVTCGGNVLIKVGSNGTVGAVTNAGRATVVKGYLHLIVEEGGSIGAIGMDNFEHKDYYRLNVDASIGHVEFSGKTGIFNFVCPDGYLAKLENGSKVIFVNAGESKVPFGEYNVTFTDEYKIADSKADVIINPAVPETSEYPISTDNAKVIASVKSVTPDDATVGYAVSYTYDVELAPAAGYALPSDFTFTINGSDDYIAENLMTAWDKVTFTYKVAETERDLTKNMISYVGGIGTVGTAPRKEFVEDGTIHTVCGQLFTQGGYEFLGYAANGEGCYNEGETYEVNGDVEFTAIWKKLTPYTVVFDGNGANAGFAPDTIETYENTYVKLPDNTYSKLGYTFVNWMDNDTLETYEAGELIHVADKNITLLAQWTNDPVTGDVVYVDAANGSASNDGASAKTAFDTIATAVSKANENLTIVVIGAATLNGDLPGLTDGTLTITGYDTNAVLNLGSFAKFGCDTIIKDIKINTATKNASLVSNGYKAVIGPNITAEGYGFDFVDGGYGEHVDKIDTVINPGVQINTYYIGGYGLAYADDGIENDSNVTINGGDIGTIDFSPKGAGSASTAAKLYGNLIVNINGGNIGDVKATLPYTKSSAIALLVFNNGTIPAIADTVVSNIAAGFNASFIVDSGIGGSIAPHGKLNSLGQVMATSDYDTYLYDKTGKLTKKTAGKSFTLIKGQVSVIRYGAKEDSTIATTVAAPTGGAEAFSITANSDNANCKIQLDGWTPDLVGGKFSYDTYYSANILITPNDGVFFDKNVLPTISINGTYCPVTYNSDGTLSASYSFETKTDYAPKLNVTFKPGVESIQGTVPASVQWGHLSTNTLPSGSSMVNLGYRFKGWLCNADGKVYAANGTYAYTANTDVEFTAQWTQRGASTLPTVLILYDLTQYANDRGRNPKFTGDYITVNNAFANLEHEINGTKATKQMEFDHEKVTFVTSDGGSNPIKINNWTLNNCKADPTEYKYLTIVYYYETKDGAAVGDNGVCLFGNVQQKDGSTSPWYGKAVSSAQKVVANKWACVTFNIGDAAAQAGLSAGTFVRQCQITPIGNKACSQLKGDTVYLKAMYFSKEAPITE